MAFVRRKGNTYFLVHNVRRQGKIRQLHLARLGERPRITDDVVRKVSRNHPFLDLDWSRLREVVNSRVELLDTRSPYVQNLMHSLRNLNLDLADLSPPLLLLASRAGNKRIARIGLVAIVGLISLLFAGLLGLNHPRATFYWMPWRAFDKTV